MEPCSITKTTILPLSTFEYVSNLQQQKWFCFYCYLLLLYYYIYECDIHTFQRGSNNTEILVFLSQIMVIPLKIFKIKYRPTVWTEYDFPLSSHSLLSVVLTAVILPSCKTIFWSYKWKDRLTKTLVLFGGA